jgi:xanthine dehydrogenase accessory factor
VAAELCVVRGGGDLATGVVWRLQRSGFRVLVTELARPLTIRRAVAVSTAVVDGVVSVEGMVARLVETAEAAVQMAGGDEIPVLVSPGVPAVGHEVLVDARLVKRPLDTSLDDAPFVVGLGPGFVVGEHCHAVVETNRGHHLGRVLWEGSAEPNTGTPGVLAGRGAERVVRAPVDGAVSWNVGIGDLVITGQRLGTVANHAITAAFDGVVRGAIASGTTVEANTKIGDIDARGEADTCFEISDKALAIGGGVVEAVCTWSRSR